MTWDWKTQTSMEKKVFVVTGANTGIGYATAKALAEKGASVVIASRTVEKGTEAQKKIGKASVFMPLDLASLSSISSFVSDFTANFQRLDGLVNNAGVMATPYLQTQDGFELQLGTNHLGHFALTQQLLPMLHASEGRIVNVSSLAYRWGKIQLEDLHSRKKYQKWAAYGQSKLANLLFTLELNQKLQKVGSKTIAVSAHPGWTSTDLQRDHSFIQFFNPLLAMSPEEGALPSLMALTDPKANANDFYGPKSWMGLKGKPGKTKAQEKAFDLQVSAKLWELSEKETQQSFSL